jgi:hypothetical protein
MRSPFALVIVSALAAVLASAAKAQSAETRLAEVQPGGRVRIVAPGILAGRFVATVITHTGDSLVLAAPNTAPVRLPLSSVTSIEISRGTSRWLGAQRGMLIGAPIGLGGGVLVAASLADCRSCGDADVARGVLVVTGVLSGLLYGAGIGALIGRERWEPFTGPWRASMQLREGRPSLALTLGL